MTEQEELYDIIQNGRGELMIALQLREGNPDQPQIIYDGGDHALFYRSKDHSIVLDYVNPHVREALHTASSVLVAEVEDEEITRGYEVPVRPVKKVPVPDLPSLEDILSKMEKDKTPSEVE